MIGVPGKMLGIFYECMDVRICTYVYELRQEHLQFQTGDVHEVHEVHELRQECSTFTNFNFHLEHTGANRQVFTPLHSNVSNRDSNCIKYYIKEESL